MRQSGRFTLSKILKRAPTWKGNLLVFGLLIVLVLGYFYRQVQQAHQTFLNHVRMSADIIAGVIQRNAGAAVLSQEVVETTIRTFLGNTARFVAYLDGVEPFTSQELSAFAAEAGLAGIRIVRKNGEKTEGPGGWLPASDIRCGKGKLGFRHLPGAHLYCLAMAGKTPPECVVVGIAAGGIEALQEQIGLDRLLETMSSQPGIAYVRVENGGRGPSVRPRGHDIQFRDLSDRKIAEVRQPLKTGQLVVGLDAEDYVVRVRLLWREFVVFSAILAGTGILLSWLLFRLQEAVLEQVRNYEREIARQREDAALGRAAASITHEIGNPLNAISMGLQRLNIEAGTLTAEHRQMIETMRSAVRRTTAIITGIRRYARPLNPNRRPVRLHETLEQLLQLYRPQCDAASIAVSLDVGYTGTVWGDAHMLEEVMENLIKNSIEAQPRGGCLDLAVRRRGSEIAFSVENEGFALSAEDIVRIAEAYFTTKTRGTGLGLSIAKRIVEAHGGRLALEMPARGRLRVTVTLPAAEDEQIET